MAETRCRCSCSSGVSYGLFGGGVSIYLVTKLVWWKAFFYGVFWPAWMGYQATKWIYER